MSRVKKPGNKFMNTSSYDSSVYGPSKKVRIHCEGEDYHKTKTLSQWLFVKYDMSYKTFRNKSKNRRNELRKEFEADTGVVLGAKSKRESDYENDSLMEYLDLIGIPIEPDDTVNR